MTKGQQDHLRIAVIVSVIRGRLNKPLNLVNGQVRSTAFLGPREATVRFSVLGVTNRRFDFSIKNLAFQIITVE
ncbi:MAG TPA: hypothetical protein VGJ20_09645 [Xanthobacteraceae bacterium]